METIDMSQESKPVRAKGIYNRLAPVHIHHDLATPVLVEMAVERGEGVLAANGAFACVTVPYTGRSPNDKFLEEDEPEKNDKIWWGNINKAVSSKTFDIVFNRALDFLKMEPELFAFDGFVGADPDYRLNVRLISAKAWHALFANTLFIPGDPSDKLKDSEPDWIIINACDLELDDYEELGLRTSTGILQSLEKRIVVICGSQYAGEIKKSIFYAMNYDMPSVDVCPMHCSANVAKDNPGNVALFFGLSGTGKTTLSADPERSLIGDDEHGWSDSGVFNFEGGCYAKCIKLSEEGEPQIWNAIRFGSVYENVVLDGNRKPDYDDNYLTENTRVTYPVSHIPNAVIPSVGGHPQNVVFLTADAFGVLPPVSRLSREQAMYYFVNGYTSKLAGTERGVTEPQPSFSPCFGGPFLPRPPQVYASMLAERVEKHDSDVWLINTGWTGGAYGTGERMSLTHTRAMVSAILDGSLAKGEFKTESAFGLRIPCCVAGVPDKVLDPKETWADKAAYDKAAADLAGRFRANDATFDLADNVRAAGPTSA